MGNLCCCLPRVTPDQSEKLTLKSLGTEVDLEHFNLLRSVGKGAFGKVRVVQHVLTNEIYALKYINKIQCCKMKAVENIIQERRLLEEISCIFVVNMRYAFQDVENMFMVIDLMLGGDLRFHLDRVGRMKENQVRFYMAELSYGLSILHSRNIVHRDLKPDNVLLDDFGHAHLTDFNIAVHFLTDKPLTAVAGSMAYMAPEILARNGYLSTIDWWSLGVMMYELVFGNRPFRAATNEALVSAILSDPIYIPHNVAEICSQECLDCILAYLTRDITKRLGVAETGGYEGIRNHPFYKDIKWADLETKKITPPFVPETKRANFDATHELEELLLEDNPLKNETAETEMKRQSTKKKPKPKPRPKISGDLAVRKAMNLMQEKFGIYDFKQSKPWQPGMYDDERRTATESPELPIGVVTESSLHRDIMEGRENDVNPIGLVSQNGIDKVVPKREVFNDSNSEDSV